VVEQHLVWYSPQQRRQQAIGAGAIALFVFDGSICSSWHG
jgi:hypothetical protein